MARIYNRDNINYAGLIGQAIQNANQTSQLYANKWQPGSTMGQAVSQAGEKLQQAGWNEWSAQQNDERAQAMQQRQFEQQEKMQQEQQRFQAMEAAKARAQQILTNSQNAMNAERLAAINKGYASIDQYNDAQDKLALIDARLTTLDELRKKENEGSPEWIKYNNEYNDELIKSINMQKRMDLALAQKDYADALLTNDPVAIAEAKKNLMAKYPASEKTTNSTDTTTPPTPPTPPQTPVETETSKEEVKSENPPVGVSWTKVGESQKKALPKQFKNDKEIEQATANAETIKDRNVRQSVLDEINARAKLGTIEGNNAKLIEKYDGTTISNRQWDAMSEDERKRILKLMKRSGTGKLTKR